MLTDMELLTVRDKLEQYAGVYESYALVARLRCWRRRPPGSDPSGGDSQEIFVDIWDAGPGVNPDLRYHVKVRSEDGKTATCNSAPNLQIALMTTHWAELDS